MAEAKSNLIRSMRLVCGSLDESNGTPCYTLESVTGSKYTLGFGQLEHVVSVKSNSIYNIIGEDLIDYDKILDTIKIINGYLDEQSGQFIEMTNSEEYRLAKKKFDIALNANLKMRLGGIYGGIIQVINDKLVYQLQSCTGNKLIIPEFVEEINCHVLGVEQRYHTIEIRARITRIEDGTFGWSSISRVILPDTLKSIGNSAFGFSHIQYIDIPKSVTEIEERAFMNCERLKEIKFNGPMETIGPFAFSGCKALIKLELPEGLTELPYGLIRDCKNIKELIIPNSVTKVDKALISYNTMGTNKLEIPRLVCPIALKSQIEHSVTQTTMRNAIWI